MICIPRYHGLERTPSGLLVPARYWRNHAAQLAHGHGHGMDMGGAPVSPLTLPGLVWGAELGKTALIQYNTQPGADFDMQTAGVANWPDYNDPTTRTKETASPAPDGLQYLHAVHTGAGAYWGPEHVGFIAGNHYAIGAGYIRAGSGVEWYRQCGAVNIQSGTGDDAWHAVAAAEADVTASNFCVFSAGSLPSYIDVSGFTCANNSLNRQNPDGGSLGGYLAEANALRMPFVSDGGVKYLGNDQFRHNGTPADWKFLHYDPANGPNFYPTFMVGVSFTTPSVLVDGTLISTTTPGLWVRSLLSGARVSVSVYGAGTQTTVQTPASSIMANKTYALIVRSDGVNVHAQLSAPTDVAVPLTHTASASDPYEPLNVGYSTYAGMAAPGYILRDAWIYNQQSDAAADALGRWMASKRGASW